MMRRGVRTRLRRLIALGTGALLAAGAMSAVTAATTTATATAAPAPFSCDAFGYLFQGNGSGGTEVDQVNLADGSAPRVATLSDHMNAVAYNELDNFFYAYDSVLQKIVKIGSDWSVTVIADPPVAGVHYNMADIDPDTGHYWISSSGTGTGPTGWAEMNLDPASPGYGSTIASGTTTAPAGLQGGADWSFIGNRLYRVMQEDTPGASEAHLVRFKPGTQNQVDLGSLGFTVSSQVGATFVDQKNDLFSSDNGDGAIWRIKVAAWLTNPAANPPFHVSTGPQSGSNDGARCANAPVPTLTLTKQVAGRVDSSDQFGVALKNSGGTTLDFATTAGTATSVSTTDVPVTQGASFTISDYMLAGSASPISNYTPTISCVDTNGGAAPPVSGSAPDWTVTVQNPTYYACTVTNTAKAADLAISKTGPATVDADGVITWQVSITNNGPDTSPGATVTDTIPAGVTNVSAPGCTVASGTVTCQVGAQAKGAPPQVITITGNARRTTRPASRTPPR